MALYLYEGGNFMDDKIFGKLDTENLEDIAEMERLLKEKYEASKGDGSKETA